VGIYDYTSHPRRAIISVRRPVRTSHVLVQVIHPVEVPLSVCSGQRLVFDVRYLGAALCVTTSVSFGGVGYLLPLPSDYFVTNVPEPHDRG
jgi:hypothetical protein